MRMRELGCGLLLLACLAVGCGKYGPPVRSVQPLPEPAPATAAPAAQPTPAPDTAAGEPAPVETPEEPPAP